MPSYEFGCDDCGPFTTILPIGTAGPVCLCPHCGAGAHRIWSAPALVGGPGPIRSLRAAAERSADSPAVVRRAPRQPTTSERCGPGAQALPLP